LFFILSIPALTLFTVALFAANRKPTVALQANKNYEVVIDGKSYFTTDRFGNDVLHLKDGYHKVVVYKQTQGFFNMRNKKVVSSSSFLLRGNDIDITLNQFGKIKIDEDARFGNGRKGNTLNKKSPVIMDRHDTKTLGKRF